MQELRPGYLVTNKDPDRQVERPMAYLGKRFAESEARMMRWTLAVGAFVIAAARIVGKVF